MTEKQIVQNNGNPHKYYHMMLNITDADLDPFQYRLLGHYVNTAGGYGNTLPEGIRETAALTKMSVNKVRAARAELQEMGYIRIAPPTEDEEKRGIATKITVLDRWAENIARCSKPVSDLTQGCVENDTGHGKDPVSDLTPIKNSKELKKEKEESRVRDVSLSSDASQTTVPQNNSSGTVKSQKTAKRKTPLQEWLERLKPVSDIVHEMLNACDVGYKNTIFDPEHYCTIPLMEKYVPMAEELRRVGGTPEDVRLVHNHLLPEYTRNGWKIAPKSIVEHFPTIRALKIVERDDEAEEAKILAESVYWSVNQFVRKPVDPSGKSS